MGMHYIESDRKIGRITGMFYLSYIFFTIIGDRFGHMGIGSADLVYQTIVSNIGAFRLGLVLTMISALLFFMAAWSLYILLRPVNSDLALLLLLLNGLGVAVQTASMLPLISAMNLGGETARLAIGVYQTGFITAQLFYGTWLFPLGYLVYKSRFLPLVIGVLLILDGVGVLIWFFQTFLFPEHRAIAYPGLAVSFVAEFSLAAWLLVRGRKKVDK